MSRPSTVPTRFPTGLRLVPDPRAGLVRAARGRGPVRCMTPSPHDRIRQADLGDELWTWAHLARLLGASRSTAFAVAAAPGFPVPLHVAGARSDRLWVAREVREHLLTLRACGPLPAPPAPVATTDTIHASARPRRAATATRTGVA